MKLNGLQPIVSGTELAAEELDDLSTRSEREISQLEELATQCSRALRNLSVNRKSFVSSSSSRLRKDISILAVNKVAITSLGASRYLHILANNSNERIAQQVSFKPCHSYFLFITFYCFSGSTRFKKS